MPSRDERGAHGDSPQRNIPVHPFFAEALHHEEKINRNLAARALHNEFEHLADEYTDRAEKSRLLGSRVVVSSVLFSPQENHDIKGVDIYDGVPDFEVVEGLFEGFHYKIDLAHASKPQGSLYVLVSDIHEQPMRSLHSVGTKRVRAAPLAHATVEFSDEKRQADVRSAWEKILEFTKGHANRYIADAVTEIDTRLTATDYVHAVQLRELAAPVSAVASDERVRGVPALENAFLDLLAAHLALPANRTATTSRYIQYLQRSPRSVYSSVVESPRTFEGAYMSPVLFGPQYHRDIGFATLTHDSQTPNERTIHIPWKNLQAYLE